MILFLSHLKPWIVVLCLDFNSSIERYKWSPSTILSMIKMTILAGAVCNRHKDSVHVSDALQQVPYGHPDLQIPGES